MKIAVLGLVTLLLGCASAQRVHALDAACPLPAEGEKAQDCPWAGLAREMLKAGNDPASVLDREAPQLATDLATARTKLQVFQNLWGRSINFDESAKGTIVETPILDLILERAGAPARQERIVHAGIEHTYGYLFSNLKTSFGYKRARWVSGEIDRGFGFSDPTIAPAPSKGSLFANITALSGKIAFRGEEALLGLIADQQKAGLVAPAVSKLDASKLEVTRLTEEVYAARTFTITTDFVKFPFDSGTSNTHLLVYSIQSSPESSPLLITVFPVEAGFVKNAVNPSGLGEGKAVSTRYNAHVEGVTGKQWTGKRSVRTWN
jgi:hypothetical protein